MSHLKKEGCIPKECMCMRCKQKAVSELKYRTFPVVVYHLNYKSDFSIIITEGTPSIILGIHV
jgi:hypothetical protein